MVANRLFLRPEEWAAFFIVKHGCGCDSLGLLYIEDWKSYKNNLLPFIQGLEQEEEEYDKKFDYTYNSKWFKNV